MDFQNLYSCFSDIEEKFASEISLHTMECFHEEWKKEFHNLLLQACSAVEVFNKIMFQHEFYFYLPLPIYNSSLVR